MNLNLDGSGESNNSNDCMILSNNQLNRIVCNLHHLSDVEKNKFVRNMVALNVCAYNELYPAQKESLGKYSHYKYERPNEAINALQSLKYLGCLEYQLRSLTDHEEYPDFKRIAACKDQLIQLISGYDSLRWTVG